MVLHIEIIAPTIGGFVVFFCLVVYLIWRVRNSDGYIVRLSD
jgi:hypothetical protein